MERRQQILHPQPGRLPMWNQQPPASSGAQGKAVSIAPKQRYDNGNMTMATTMSYKALNDNLLAGWVGSDTSDNLLRTWTFANPAISDLYPPWQRIAI